MRPTPAQMGLIKAVHNGSFTAVPDKGKVRRTWRSMEGRWVYLIGGAPALTPAGLKLVQEPAQDVPPEQPPALESDSSQAPPAALDLDALARRWTVCEDFADLLEGDRPSIYPPPFATAEDVVSCKALADAYDDAQTARGDARRVHRGEPHYWRAGQASGPAHPEYELYPDEIDEKAGCFYRVCLPGGQEIGRLQPAGTRARKRVYWTGTPGQGKAVGLHEGAAQLVRQAKKAPEAEQLALLGGGQ